MGRKPCIRCGSKIDAGARVCVFCNQDQTAPVVASVVLPLPARRQGDEWGTRALVISVVGIFLVATFTVAALVHGMTGGSGAARTKQAISISTSSTQNDANFSLVPLTETTANDRLITSTPPSVSALGTSAEPTDATALPSEEYSRAIQHPAAPAPPPSVVDPRTITAPREPLPEPDRPASRVPPGQQSPERPAANRTPPVPTSQPLPDIEDVKTGGTLRLNLLVGTDGKVKEIEVIRTVPELHAEVLASVRKWRFDPATLDGRPVEGHFTVDISFNPR
jgi:TonB family protein